MLFYICSCCLSSRSLCSLSSASLVNFVPSLVFLSANLQMAGESMRMQIALIGFELAFLENEKVSLYYKCSI